MTIKFYFKQVLPCLILLFSASQLSQAQNLLDLSGWTIGQGSTGVFQANGQASENIREWGEGPNGKHVVLWKAVPEGAAHDDGGWNTSSFSVDHTKMYRFSVWIKKTNSSDGHTYLGCGAALNLGGNFNDNPYFWAGDLPQLDKWYLLVGYVHGSGDASTTNYSAIYDGVTGAKVITGTHFKFPAGVTSSYHRTYLFYDPNTNDRQYFYAPRVDEVNGNEPSVETLLGVANTLAGEVAVNGNLSLKGTQVFNTLNNQVANTPGWIKLGTLNLPQGGNNANLKIYGGNGYNADIGQQGEVE